MSELLQCNFINVANPSLEKLEVLMQQTPPTPHPSAWPSLAFYVKKTDSCRVLFVSHLKVIPKAFQSYSKGLKLGKWCHFWIVNLVLEALLTPHSVLGEI